jgi:hypothetical protein
MPAGVSFGQSSSTPLPASGRVVFLESYEYSPHRGKKYLNELVRPSQVPRLRASVHQSEFRPELRPAQDEECLNRDQTNKKRLHHHLKDI